MVNYASEYGILSTFERSWLCKIELDNEGFLKPVMKIKGPFATSPAAQKSDSKYCRLPQMGFIELVFLHFSLTHKSTEKFSHKKRSKMAIPIRELVHSNENLIFQSLSLRTDEKGYLGEGRSGDVSIGNFNNQLVAVKVKYFVL